MAAPNGLIVAWPTAASIPSGWSRYTALDDKVPKPASSSIGTTGGADTHTHVDNHTHTDSHTHDGAETGASGYDNQWDYGSSPTVADDHTHTVSFGNASGLTTGAGSTATSSGTSIGIARYSVRWIQSDGTTDIPVDAVAWSYDTTGVPSGWSAFAAGVNYYLRGAATGVNGGAATAAASHNHTYSSHTHSHSTASHTHSVTSPSGTGGGVWDQLTGGATNLPPASHTHNVTGGPSGSASHSTGTTGSNTAGTSDSQTPDLAYYKLQTVQATSAAAAPGKLVALWTSTSAPAGWRGCDGTNGTPNINGSGNYIKGANGTGEIGNTGGSNTHTHAGGSSHNHSSAATGSTTHTLSISITSAYNGTALKSDSAGGSLSYSQSGTSHSHTSPSATGDRSTANITSASPSGSSSNHEPAYVNMYFIMSMGTSKPRGIMKSYNELSRLIAKVGI